MRARAGHRQPGQAFVFAAIAMVALVGALAMVIDTGIFFVVQRQLQSAADAGALAGAWHIPICGVALPPPVGPPCISTPAAPPPVGAPVPGTDPWVSCATPPPVTNPPTPASCARCTGAVGAAACDVALANAETIKQLCNGTVDAVVAVGTQLVNPSHVNTIVVTVECDASFSFGRILGLFSQHITASAAAGIGDRNASPITCYDGGDMMGFTSTPPCGWIARLIE